MSIYIGEGFAVALTNSLNIQPHKHNALQITVSVEFNRKLQCHTEHGLINGEVILIPPLTNHAFAEETGLVLIILIDDESIVAESISEGDVKSLDEADFQNLKDSLSEANDLAVIQSCLLKTKFFRKLLRRPLDKRIRNLIAKLKDDEDFSLTAANSAGACNLSESRFLHLFKKELGLPFRKYIQWIKLKRALKYIEMGNSITEAAHFGGFSDSAHLSRYFKDTFGLTPSEVVQNSQFIQAH